MWAVYGRFKHRIIGIGFIVLLGGSLTLAIAGYNGAFREHFPVTLRAAVSGSQLHPGAEVRFHGVEVGTVERIGLEQETAVINLALRPDAKRLIPANVTARILPKTLLGQNYVDLVLPPEPVSARISAGEVIPEDRSETAIALQKALDNVLPLLRAVEPHKIAMTLNAVAGAVEHRGEQLGNTLVSLEDYVAKLNPAVPALREDIRALVKFAHTYTDAVPDLLQALENMTTTAQTLVDRRSDLKGLYAELTTLGTEAGDFLEANGDNLIDTASTSRQTLQLLGRYAPEFPCLLSQLAGLIPRLREGFGADTDKPGLHIMIEINNNRGRYVPGKDMPEYNDNRGPHCYPIQPAAPQYPPAGPLRDGSVAPPAADHYGRQPEPGSPDRVLKAPGQAVKWGGLLLGPLLNGTGGQ